MTAADIGKTTTTRKVYKTRAGTLARGQSNVLWYAQPEETQWENLIAHVKSIRQRQVRRRFDLVCWQEAYVNNGTFGSSSLFRANSASTRGGAYRKSCDVIKSIIDTGSARIAKDKPRVFILPSTGDQELITRAENATKFLDGAFIAGHVYESYEDAFRDGLIYGDGYVHFLPHNGQIVSECLKVDEVVIDEVLGMRNDPQEIHIDRAEPRTKLLAEFPEFEKQIEEAKGAWKGELAYLGEQDQVRVFRSWRKPSAEKSGDGRECVAIEGCTLRSEPYEKDYLPVDRWQWCPPTYGPFGIGIPQELEGPQAALTEVNSNIMRGIRLFAHPRVWVDKASGCSVHTLTNGVSVNQYMGNKPVFETPPAASPDVYQLQQWWIDWMYKKVGLSQLTAQSEKPAGLNSGVGLRNYQDIETQRFAIVGQRWERHHVHAAMIVLDMAADLYKEKGKLAVTVPGRGFVERIDWKDVSMKRDQYDAQAFPTSLLPRTPEGQLQSVTEIMSSGLMPREVALGQLKIPNLNAWIEEETASRDNINMCLSRIRNKKVYRGPNGIADIDAAVKLAMSAWLRADMDDEGDPNVADMLLRFLNEATELKRQKDAASAPPPAPGGAANGAPVVGQAPPPPTAPMAPAGSGPVTAAAA